MLYVLHILCCPDCGNCRSSVLPGFVGEQRECGIRAVLSCRISRCSGKILSALGLLFFRQI